MEKKDILSALSLSLLCLMLLFAYGCHTEESKLTDFLNNSDYPQDYWQTSTPSAQGMDEKILKDMINHILGNGYGIQSLLIVKNGYLVFERYGYLHTPDTIHVLNSTTKSFVSALVGIAVSEGYIAGIEDRMLDYFDDISVENMSQDKKKITIEQLLKMRSGMEWNDREILMEYFMSENAVQYILDKRMVDEPDTKWHYNSGSSHLLSAIITRTTGKSAAEYARIKLFMPLGISRYEWNADRQDINRGGLGLAMTPRDMAKFGYLYLNKGKWNNDQIIPEEWVTVSTSVHSDTYWSGKYGYHWWIPDESCFASQGANGQNIYVYPEKNIVIVYTAGLPVETADATLLKLNNDFIIPAIVY